jgi:hypothetical protein
MSKATETSYKGHPTISLGTDTRFPFNFGLEKAKLVVEHIDAIRAFVAKHDKAARHQPDQFDMQVEDNMRDACGL